MDVSVVIVSFNTSQLLCKCVESVYQSNLKNLQIEVIVVDNNSTDDSELQIKSQFPQVKWLQQSYNSGFSRANNLGIETSKGKYLLFLNSDIVLNPNTISECFEHITANQYIGVLSCRLLNDDGSVQRYESTIASFRKVIDNNLIINYFFPVSKFKQEAVMGSFMLIPKEVLNICGSFDPDFFFYSEEIELCNRIRNKNFDIQVLENVFAYHKGSGSNTDRTWSNRQAYLSQSLMFYKVKSLSGFYLFHLILHFNFILNFFTMWKLDARYRKGYFKDLKNYLSVYVRIMQIPFLYSKKIGKGKRLLKY